MSATTDQIRVIVLANKSKAQVPEELDQLLPWLSQRAKVVAVPDITMTADEDLQWPQADLAVVLGGDGTMLAQARRILDLTIPLLGVNFGKLGFLAEFSIDDLHRHWDQIATGSCSKTSRLMVDVMVFDADAADCHLNRFDMDHLKARSSAMNDAVITAGSPFRMIELALAIDPTREGEPGTVFAGDGVILSTPSGSTAHNMAAGGPIVSPDQDALCITPICPQSLAFRPIVTNADSVITVRVMSANPGSTLVIDGQASVSLETGDQVVVRRHARRLTVVQNPDLNYWQMLARKMRWAARPRRR